jgi:hypothetical protein
MQPGREAIGSVAFAIGVIAFGLSLVLFLLDLRTMHFAMAFRMLAPAILQGFSLMLFRDCFAASGEAASGNSANSAQLPRVG